MEELVRTFMNLQTHQDGRRVIKIAIDIAAINLGFDIPSLGGQEARRFLADTTEKMYTDKNDVVQYWFMKACWVYANSVATTTDKYFMLSGVRNAIYAHIHSDPFVDHTIVTEEICAKILSAMKE